MIPIEPARSLFNEANRDLLLGQHVILRRMLAGIAAIGDRCVREVEQASELIARIAELRPFFEWHLRSEETCLEPVLAHLEPMGAVRLQTLYAAHAHQRAVFSALAQSGARLELRDPARFASALVEDLLADMDAEESDLFFASGLQRDWVNVFQGGA